MTREEFLQHCYSVYREGGFDHPLATEFVSVIESVCEDSPGLIPEPVQESLDEGKDRDIVVAAYCASLVKHVEEHMD